MNPEANELQMPATPLSEMSRRDVLKLGLAAAGATLVEKYFKWTIPEGEVKHDLLNFSRLKEEFNPVEPSAAVASVKHVKALIGGELPFNELDPNVMNTHVGEIIQDVRNLRNIGIQFPALTQDIVAILSFCNTRFSENVPYSGFSAITTPEEARINNLQLLKLEAFFALRNYYYRGLVAKDVLDAFAFDGYVSYFSDGTGVELGGNYKQGVLPDTFGFYDVPQEVDTLAHTDEVIKSYWPLIADAARTYDVDPFYIASLISMEARDQKSYWLFRFDGSDLKDVTLNEELLYGRAGEVQSATVINDVLAFLQKNRDVAKNFLPHRISEDTVDLLGAVAGSNTSLGPGQINIETAKRFGLAKVAGRAFTDETPDAVIGLLLTNPQVNINAIAAYTKTLIDSYAGLQESGFNAFLPDLKANAPTLGNIGKPLGPDPVYGSDFTIAFYGGCYTSKEYPEYRKGDKLSLRVPENVHRGWGAWVAGYYAYYTKNKERLGLNI